MNDPTGGLYSAAIMEHCRRPRCRGELPDADGAARAWNPHCGDDLTVAVRIRDGRLEEVRFEGSACAIAVASASMMAGAVAGCELAEVERISAEFLALVQDGLAPGTDLGSLADFAAVSRYPGREKCAGMAWLALQCATGLEQPGYSTGSGGNGRLARAAGGSEE